MNFFEEQDRRRRNTYRLILLFLCAVVGIILAVYAVIWAGYGYHLSGASNRLIAPPPFFLPKLFLYVVVGTCGVILIGSLYMRALLSGGGKIVAERMGGIPLPEDPKKPKEKQLRNVIEEMAIASGTPVPAIFVLTHEHGINALAAGYSPSDAAVAVSRGAMETLDRDELQGVIAHEFSHILNGDMRLNMRLIAILHGILIIGLTGYFLVRSSGSGRQYSRRRADPRLMLVGVGLILIGYVGVFFGKLIKAAVSRQREYLADASAVQFTRNPSGIAGALQKIGGDRWGARMNAPRAEEMSHMFFASAFRGTFFTALSTHPPLDRRIRMIDPTWDGTYRETRKTEALPGMDTRVQELQPKEMPPPLSNIPAVAVLGGTILAGDVIGQIGNPTAEHVAYASALVSSLPEPVSSAIRDGKGAKAIIYALLLDPNEEIRKRQIDAIEKREEDGMAATIRSLRLDLETLGGDARLPLVDLALPTLRKMSREDYNRFGTLLRDLVGADEKISLFEYVLITILKRHLRSTFQAPERRIAQYHSLRPLLGDCQILLSFLAHEGNDAESEAVKSFAVGAHHLKKPGMMILPREELSFGSFDHSVQRLGLAAPAIKQRVMTACAHTILGDQKVTVEEAELIRAIGDTLDCPVPPLLSAA